MREVGEEEKEEDGQTMLCFVSLNLKYDTTEGFNRFLSTVLFSVLS